MLNSPLQGCRLQRAGLLGQLSNRAGLIGEEAEVPVGTPEHTFPRPEAGLVPSQALSGDPHGHL